MGCGRAHVGRAKKQGRPAQGSGCCRSARHSPRAQDDRGWRTRRRTRRRSAPLQRHQRRAASAQGVAAGEPRTDHASRGATYVRKPDDRGWLERPCAYRLYGPRLRDDHERPLWASDARHKDEAAALLDAYLGRANTRARPPLINRRRAGHAPRQLRLADRSSPPAVRQLRGARGLARAHPERQRPLLQTQRGGGVRTAWHPREEDPSVPAAKATARSVSQEHLCRPVRARLPAPAERVLRVPCAYELASSVRTL